MAIKLPDPGNGIPEQKTGNDEWTNMKIVRDNFADTSNAASRLVGESKDNVMQVGAFGIGLGRGVTLSDPSGYYTAKGAAGTGFRVTTPAASLIKPSLTGSTVNASDSYYAGVITNMQFNDSSVGEAMHRIILRKHNIDLQYVVRRSGGALTDLEWSPGVCVYTGGNTTIDSNKNIKTSSPVVRVFSDHLDKIHEANQLPIKYTRNGVGDYTIEGTTGLRENDWQIVIPEDDHRNQLIAFTIEDDNGTIRLKIYKRTFNMTTFMFEPDLSTPLDIPEGRWVDLHFNDLPQEQLDEPVI